MKDKETGGNIVRRCTYSIEYIVYTDGTTRMNRRCDKFTPLELLGLLALTSDEIVAQMRGEIKPDIVKREFVDE